MYYFFFFKEGRAGEQGEGGKSHRRTAEAGSGLRWRGGDGTDINPSNACLSIFSSPLSVFQVSGRRRKGNIRIHYSPELCAVLTRDIFVLVTARVYLFLFF